jgi:hypothetical protein
MSFQNDRKELIAIFTVRMMGLADEQIHTAASR